MSSVFLSHSHLDKTFVRKLAADLRAKGHTVWVDEAEIRIGDSLVHKIGEGIEGVDFVAAVISESSVRSPWVQRELDLATNREIDEGRVVVLPLLLQDVELPTFLRGKMYGDFRDEGQYGQSLEQLLASLGPGVELAVQAEDDLESLREQLRETQAIADHYRSSSAAYAKSALRNKDPQLLTAIENENKRHPEYAPINNVYAFEAMGKAITLGYLLHATRKAIHRGGHILDLVLKYDNKWDEAEAMLEAYVDLRASLEESRSA